MQETTSLLKNIENRLGEDIKEKVEKISYESNIYILYLVDIHEVTRKDLEIGYASYHARYPDRDFESYVRMKRNWDQDRFTFDIEPQGYFIDRKTAVEYTEANIGDINEAGAYPYVIVSSMPLNRVYPMCNCRDHTLFHFNKKTERYEEVDWDHSEGTRMLKEKGSSGWY
jgi:hypothetical protein